MFFKSEFLDCRVGAPGLTFNTAPDYNNACLSKSQTLVTYAQSHIFSNLTLCPLLLSNTAGKLRLMEQEL
jgi:hypothetical protein